MPLPYWIACLVFAAFVVDVGLGWLAAKRLIAMQPAPEPVLATYEQLKQRATRPASAFPPTADEATGAVTIDLDAVDPTEADDAA